MYSTDDVSCGWSCFQFYLHVEAIWYPLALSAAVAICVEEVEQCSMYSCTGSTTPDGKQACTMLLSGL